MDKETNPKKPVQVEKAPSEEKFLSMRRASSQANKYRISSRK